MTINQKRKIKNLEEALSVVNKQERSSQCEISKLKKLVKSLKNCKKPLKVCKYCGHSPTQLPESKKDRNTRVMNGINELKERGVMQ